MIRNTPTLAFLTALAVPVFCGAETGNEQYLEVGQTCAGAHEPKTCMESYGFRCHQGRRVRKSVEALTLGCNLDLGDGRAHFVQMLYDDGGWNVETEDTYWPEQSEVKMPEEDPALALSSYIDDAMQGYSTHSSGSGTIGLDTPRGFQAGARRVDGRISVRALCGVVLGQGHDAAVTTKIESYCESRLFGTVRKLSQSQTTGPYRVAGPSEFAWERRFVTLVSGDPALVLEGRYSFTDTHTPCIWNSDCCSPEGTVYLDSCRTPTADDLQIIDECLSEERAPRSEEFFACLRTAGVEVGCEVQSDGSRICH